jgi:steroid 5-alpha reductase family enzyme
MVAASSAIVQTLHHWFSETDSDLDALKALSVVSLLALLPLTLIRNAYCFEAGYGASVGVMSLALLVAFHDDVLRHPRISLLALAAVLYGMRLASFLLYREFSVPKMDRQTKEFDQKSKTLVLPLIVILAVFYACMVSPILFAFRSNVDSMKTLLEGMGVILAYLGLMMETVADLAKLLFKRHQQVVYGQKTFVSPTTGLYSLCRHPNYTGEILFWTGLYVGGMAATDGMVGRVAGTLGWLGIVWIMLGSAKRLDTKQEKLYGGQRPYEAWKAKVPHSLVPSFPQRMLH